MKAKIAYQEGDLFGLLPPTGKLVIPHVVNTVGAFSAGFVVPLSKNYPRTGDCYRRWCKEGKAQDSEGATIYFRLGHTLMQRVHSDKDKEVYVAHMLAQDGLPSAANRRPLSYQALTECMQAVGDFATNVQAAIHSPLFGAGIAGGEWSKIETLIRQHWLKHGLAVTCYYLKDKLPPGFHVPPTRPKT